MKVLFITYPRIGLGHGGFEIQIEKTCQELRHIGVEVLLYDPWKNQIPEVDVCHVFSTDGTLIYHVEKAVGMRIPVIISPVFNCFTVPFWVTALKVKLSRYIPGMYSDLKRAEKMLVMSSRILALNQAEQRLLLNSFNIMGDKCTVVPNGINTSLMNGDCKLFEHKFGVKGFVLQVASIEPRKNQLNLIKAMSKTPYPLVLIGKAPSSHQDYYDKCQAIAGGNVFFIGQLDNADPLLASAFASAKVFALPSYSEVMPLTIYEAAVAGCKVIVSKFVPVAENISRFVKVVNPDDPTEIAEVIMNVMSLPEGNDLQEAATAMPSWSEIAGQIHDIYLRAIQTK